MEPRLGGAQRDAEGTGRVGQRQVQVVAQHEDRALLRLQPAEHAVEQVAIDDGGRVIGHRRIGEGCQGDLDHLPALTPRGVDAGTHGEAVEPGVEPFRFAQGRQLAPGLEHRVLDGVSRELRIPDDEAGGCVQPSESRVDEHGEGVMIASPGSPDQLQLLHDRLSMRRDPTWSRYRVLTTARSRIVPSERGHCPAAGG